MERFIFKKNVVFRKEDDGALLYDHDTGEILPLNESAADWCELLFANSFDMKAAEFEMRSRYEVDKGEDISGDMDEIIAVLKEKGYIVLAGKDS
ncbi:MAG: PqqD family protein [Thermodesulfovibrionales bacterium]|nr:PqqD family protein [Thermodesulfovibrionales bacterium]